VIKLTDAIGDTISNVMNNEQGDQPQAEQSPGLPGGLVGEQDDRAGRSGNRHVSGPLAGEHGGAGDADTDFETLTGGRSGPAPGDRGYPEGTRVGENGIAIRPGTDEKGPRIDIPANEDKPHETLHYPLPEDLRR